MIKRCYTIIFIAFFVFLLEAKAQAAVIIKIDEIPKFLQADQEYDLYITAKNTSDDYISNTSLQLTLKDKYSDIDDVLINKDFSNLLIEIEQGKANSSAVLTFHKNR
ncbi:MAG: hypothetical protein FGM23_00445 [Alphaproteobacteria bacterium]|nr:hypothetical protein [Alphaproteobacteria bacterium]